MTKKDLIQHLVDEGLVATKKESTKIVDAVFSAMQSALAGGGTVNIPGFAKLEVVKRSARKGYSPITKTYTDQPEYNAVKFKPFKALKDAVK